MKHFTQQYCKQHTNPPAHRALVQRSMWLILLALVMLGSSLMSCSKAPGSPTTPTPTASPTLTPTPEPLGSQGNPLRMGMVITRPEVQTAAEDLAKEWGKNAQLVIQVQPFATYQGLLQEMQAGKVHIAWFPPLTYLYAQANQIAEVSLLTNHFGVYQYGTQFLAHVQSGFTPYFDPISNRSTADAATALQQFAGKRPCWVEPLSPSGYLAPYGLLLQQNVQVQDGVIAQSHTSVIRALYVRGICDFGATFATSGDPRTSASVLGDLSDAMTRITILWRSDPVIPNLNLSYLPALPEGLRQTLNTTLLDLVKTDSGKDLISQANDYSVQDLKPITDETYAPLRDLITQVGASLSTMIGK